MFFEAVELERTEDLVLLEDGVDLVVCVGDDLIQHAPAEFPLTYFAGVDFHASTCPECGLRYLSSAAIL